MAHLTHKQRYTISCMLKRGYKQVEIAKAIGKNKSVICREKKRNSDKSSNVYNDELTQKKYAKPSKREI